MTLVQPFKTTRSIKPISFSLTYLTLIVFTALFIASAQGASVVGITNCDRFAVHPSDPNKPKNTPGVWYDDIPLGAALIACQQATKQWPNESRFIVALGRIYNSLSDSKKALSYFQKAREMGNPLGLTFYASALYSGAGIKADSKTALKLLKEAVKTNNSTAWVFYGQAFEHGIATPKKPHEAIKAYKKAIALNNPYAMALLANIYWEMDGKERQAVRLYRRAWDAGFKDVAYDLAFAYDARIGTKFKPKKAAELYFEALKRGQCTVSSSLEETFEDWSPTTVRHIMSRLKKEGYLPANANKKAQQAALSKWEQDAWTKRFKIQQNLQNELMGKSKE